MGGRQPKQPHKLVGVKPQNVPLMGPGPNKSHTHESKPAGPGFQSTLQGSLYQCLTCTWVKAKCRKPKLAFQGQNKIGKHLENHTHRGAPPPFPGEGVASFWGGRVSDEKGSSPETSPPLPQASCVSRPASAFPDGFWRGTFQGNPTNAFQGGWTFTLRW